MLHLGILNLETLPFLTRSQAPAQAFLRLDVIIDAQRSSHLCPITTFPGELIYIVHCLFTQITDSERVRDSPIAA